MESATSPPATPAPAPEAKRSLFETIVTSTPVLLTVIATFMVGQSSGEMTKAQYYRSVASQNQSKVGDQWGFFQAKRIRGQVLEGNADLLLAQKRDRFNRATLIKAAESLVKDLRAARKSLKPLSKEKEQAAALKELDNLIVEAEATLAAVKSALNPPADGWQGETHLLKPQTVQNALEALQPKPSKKSKPSKSPKSSEEASEQTALLDEIIVDIKKRKLEPEIAPKVLRLSDETLQQAIMEADRRADEVYNRGKSIENVLEEFDALVERQGAIVFEYQQIAARILILTERSEKDDFLSDFLQKLPMFQRENQANLQGDYKAARHAFSARRYEDDARSNQDSAYLYEVKVYLSSARSDKHLFRSKMFLFAMLVAQVGVTIATLAMAVRRKSVFWLLATLTGLIAIGFGTYVYLDLWPIPNF